MISDRTFLTEILPRLRWKAYEFVQRDDRTAGLASKVVVELEDDVTLFYGARIYIPIGAGVARWSGDLTFKKGGPPPWARDPGLPAVVMTTLFDREFMYDRTAKRYRVNLESRDLEDDHIEAGIRFLVTHADGGLPYSKRGRDLLKSLAKTTDLGTLSIGDLARIVNTDLEIQAINEQHLRRHLAELEEGRVGTPASLVGETAPAGVPDAGEGEPESPPQR